MHMESTVRFVSPDWVAIRREPRAHGKIQEDLIGCSYEAVLGNMKVFRNILRKAKWALMSTQTG